MVSDTPNSTQQPAQANIAAPQPLVSLQRGVQRPPQDLPNLMSHHKPSTSTSPLFALSRARPPKPSSTAPVAIEPQSKKHAEVLAELGIKVRDFAYESKLPPVQPYRVRQVQPGLRPLKRTRRDGGEVDDVSQDTEAAEGDSPRRSKLRRTESEITRPQTFGFFLSFNDRHPKYIALCQSQSQSQPAADSSESQPLDSQNLDPYDVTPTVTPNGSLIWPDVVTSTDIPALQLDTEPQANDSVLLAYSQPGPEPEPSDSTGTGLVGILTPMSSLSSVGSDVPPNPLDSWSTNALSPSPPVSPIPSKLATPPSSHYQLRRRPTSPQSPTKSGLHGRKTTYKAAYPLPRPGVSSHSKAKPTHG